MFWAINLETFLIAVMSRYDIKYKNFERVPMT